MARFMADIQGQAGATSRLGSTRSGIYSHARGWNLGVQVEGGEGENGKDEFFVRITGGSNNHSSRFVFRVYEDDDGNIMIRYNGHAYEVLDGELLPLVVGINN